MTGLLQTPLFFFPEPVFTVFVLLCLLLFGLPTYLIFYKFTFISF